MDPLIRTARKCRPAARIDDNWVDRLSSRYTVLLLLAVTVLLSIAGWVRPPMSCWFPKNFDIDHRQYLHSQCWVENIYYLPYTREIPKAHEHDKRRVLLYYQWIPWILLSQAFLFWLPSGIWHWLSSRSGLDTKNILQMAQILQSTKKLDTREKRVKGLAMYIDYFLSHKELTVQSLKDKDTTTGCECGTQSFRCFNGSFLTFSYTSVKFLYLVNLIFQLFALSGLLKTHYESHGVDYLRYLYGTDPTEDGEVWNSPIFPRIAFCDYIIRALGNNRRYTAQCVLTFNIYLERLYLFLWFWIVFLFLFTFIDFGVWFLRNVVRKDRLNFIRNQLQEGEFIMNAKLEQESTARFVDKYLRHDGAFVLRLITHNTNAITASDITGELWKIWKGREIDDSTAPTDDKPVVLVGFNKRKSQEPSSQGDLPDSDHVLSTKDKCP